MFFDLNTNCARSQLWFLLFTTAQFRCSRHAVGLMSWIQIENTYFRLWRKVQLQIQFVCCFWWYPFESSAWDVPICCGHSLTSYNFHLINFTNYKVCLHWITIFKSGTNLQLQLCITVILEYFKIISLLLLSTFSGKRW